MDEDVDPRAVDIPRAPVLPMDTPTPVREGWWEDPVAPGYPQMRYHDGTDRTEFVAPIRTNGANWIMWRPFTDEIEETPDCRWPA
jgi:hypothetical protein